MPTGFSLFRGSSSSFLFSLCGARVHSKGAENSIRHCSALWVVIVEVEGNDEGNTSFTCLGGSGICYSNRWWRKSIATITKKVIFFEPRLSVPKKPKCNQFPDICPQNSPWPLPTKMESHPDIGKLWCTWTTTSKTSSAPLSTKDVTKIIPCTELIILERLREHWKHHGHHK